MAVSPILRFHSKINWVVTTVCLLVAGLVIVLVYPDHKKENAWEFYAQMVKGYDRIQQVELSELEGTLKTVVEKRNTCYEGLANPVSRLDICRKHYLYDILAAARENIKAAPSLGKFMLCVRECPLAYSMCRGADAGDKNINEECTVKEVQSIELCLDRYWRGDGQNTP